MQKATPEILHAKEQESFLVRQFGAEAFLAPFHYHAEYELTYIATGKGKRYVASSMEDFDAHDFVLIAANIPHCWKLYPERQSDAKAIVLQFRYDFLGESFFQHPELAHLNEMLQRANGGLKFTGATEEVNILKKLTKTSGAERLILFLRLFHRLSQQTSSQIVLEESPQLLEKLKEDKRIHVIMAYIVEHFKTDISLDAIAEIANLTPNAFCKYFKRLTRKTFMETVIQFRLNYAMQLLVQTDQPISHIAMESGFSDVSHFYKTFRSKIKTSPLSYRKRFMK